MCGGGAPETRNWVLGSRGVGVTGDCELLDAGTGNRTWVL